VFLEVFLRRKCLQKLARFLLHPVELLLQFFQFGTCRMRGCCGRGEIGRVVNVFLPQLSDVALRLMLQLVEQRDAFLLLLKLLLKMLYILVVSCTRVLHHSCRSQIFDRAPVSRRPERAHATNMPLDAFTCPLHYFRGR
jgi:hypothetical protein